ncbi:nuclear transport factor 2 family protein [Flavobacterium sp. DG1-102-2]|uniref:nuclear transport factor 2 family protein n=1 Tax=Flavobacterium sp. DG1-102-2 TaxID=3081663 RepID=UPI0029498FF4|nr:nuclear transport factor 2 family protein [Flavobacterium sp. DG1-102-2]MDV6167130.1 nuclear transport factor 2 family protein [Flavobacterium sp. DG1-102-2]
MDNKEILLAANAAVSRGDNNGFLAFCAEEIIWEFVGEQTLQGKKAILEYMESTYLEPPKFNVENLVAEGEYVTAVGNITIKDKQGNPTAYDYCDLWRFRNGKMVALKAFVIAGRQANYSIH